MTQNPEQAETTAPKPSVPNSAVSELRMAAAQAARQAGTGSLAVTGRLTRYMRELLGDETANTLEIPEVAGKESTGSVTALALLVAYVVDGQDVTAHNTAKPPENAETLDILEEDQGDETPEVIVTEQ